MFCSKCGKEIESGTICNECLASENTDTMAAETAVASNPAFPDPENKKFGFVKALIGAIVAFLGWDTAIGSKSLVTILLGEVSSSADDILLVAALIALIIPFVLLPFIIVPCIMGIGSIKTFIARKNANCAKPVITLVFGIVALALALITVFVGFALLGTGIDLLDVYL